MQSPRGQETAVALLHNKHKGYSSEPFEYRRAEPLGDSQVGQQGQERSWSEEDHEEIHS